MEKPATLSLPAILSCVRRDNTQDLRIQPTAKERLDDEWKRIIPALERLQKDVRGYPQLRYFTISSDAREAVVKIDDGSPRGFSLMILSRRHPDKPAGPDDRVWLTNVGVGDEAFSEAVTALAELFSRITKAISASPRR